jgi:hypothetical protein
MKIIAILCLVLFAGCAAFKKEKPVEPPRVGTAGVIQSLEDVKTELAEAGMSNRVVEKKIDAAIELSERLEKILEGLEKDYNVALDK